MKKQITTSIVLVALAFAVPVAAQDPPPAPEQQTPQTQPPAMIAKTSRATPMTVVSMTRPGRSTRR